MTSDERDELRRGSMPRAIVKQPDGQYALWSTVVDNFVTVNATVEDLVAEELRHPRASLYHGGIQKLQEDLCREVVNLADTGRAWKWAPTWDEAVKIIRDLHGEDAVAELRTTMESEEAE